MVVRGHDGKEQVLWGKDLRRCSSNPHSRQDPYDSYLHNKWNRKQLCGVKVGTVVEHRACTVVVPPSGCAARNKPRKEWVKSKVLRVVRSGCTKHIVYSVPTGRCIHDESVKVTKRMLSRARRDNRLWSQGCRSHSTCTERHVVSPDTYDHLRDWIFSTDFLEPLKATEQATQRGHCFAVREAAKTTFQRYQVTPLTLTTLTPPLTTLTH